MDDMVRKTLGITGRIDAITKMHVFNKVQPAPKSVKIEITSKCNYRCGFCALKVRGKQSNQDMDFGMFQRIVTEMAQAGVQEIGVFYIGESFMSPKLLVDCIRFAKSKVPYVFLTSNASLASPDAVYECMEAGLDSLKWSINAADEAQFKEIMCVKPAYHRMAFLNIRRAKDARDTHGFDCGLYASSIKYDGKQQEKMESMLDEHVRPYVDEHYWLPLYSFGNVAAKNEAELGFRPTAGNQGRLDNLRTPIPCWNLFTEGHVRADGSMSLCGFDADGRFVVGDLTKQSFMEAWNSDIMQKARDAHLRKDLRGTCCEECVAY